MPFEESRRLTGHNRFFDGPGAVLETGVHDPATLESWRGRVELARRELRWPPGEARACAHRTGASLALAAPVDQLITATEVNEWALAASIAERAPARAAELVAALAAEQPEETEPPVLESPGALLRLRRRAAREAQPRLRALIDAATARRLPWLLDDDALTLGAGRGGHSWPLTELPAPGAVDWGSLQAIPTALVTGTNGKTTVVRLLAACLKASGLTTGYCCTDGVFVADEAIGTGDYSGPAGARRVLRDARTEAAVLETARGGILRRGLAVTRANVAVITSIAADHFGEYGVHDEQRRPRPASQSAGSRRMRTRRSSSHTGTQEARRRVCARAGSCSPGAAMTTTSARCRRCRSPRADIRTSTSRTSRPPRSVRPASESRPRRSQRSSRDLARTRRTTPAGSCATSSAAST